MSLERMSLERSSSGTGGASQAPVPGGCVSCRAADCRLSTAVAARDFRGGRLVWASLAVFIGPLLLALTGAIGLGPTLEGQLFGVASGLVLGGLLGGLVVMVLARKDVG